MATPYLQLRQEEVPSTQDLARAELDRLPVVVIAQRQSAGRGRTGAGWVSAPRALAVSVAFNLSDGGRRPWSLIAGLAAVRALGGASLKWPNDIVIGEPYLKVGGILVELSAGVVVAGLGVNLWWPRAPDGVGALHDEDPGPKLHAGIAGVWAAEFIDLIGEEPWPIDEYRKVCVTLGRDITWDPDGSGRAVDLTEDGELVVRDGTGLHTITSGAIRHLRG
ncbi:MAG: biotin--[acetyl-CoA-carboxylase] ligase [Acidimicrobiia bacterium]